MPPLFQLTGIEPSFITGPNFNPTMELFAVLSAADKFQHPTTTMAAADVTDTLEDALMAHPEKTKSAQAAFSGLD